MKILLLGEYSGLYKFLKEGLQELGHEVCLMANGDGWKKIDGADCLLTEDARGKNFFIKFYKKIISPIFDTKKYDGYDVIQIVNPAIFLWPINWIMMRIIRKKAKKLYVSVAGPDYYVYKAWEKGIFRYDVFDDNDALIRIYNGKNLMSKAMRFSTKYLMKNADGIIPSEAFIYSEPYRKFKNVTRTIAFPINLKDIEYSENVVSDKITIFHGINRIEEKGSRYIIEAMRIIEEKYPERVRCLIFEKLPFNEYKRILSETNIVIDQCKSYGYGINACISMAQGKIVMGGLEREVEEMGKIKECPIINILPCVDDIVKKIENIMNWDESKFIEVGRKGRSFVSTYHNYLERSKDYLACWSK